MERSPRALWLGAALTLVLLIPTAAMAAPATVPPLRIGPPYYSQCYGTENGSVLVSSSGTWSATPWSNTNQTGQLSMSSQVVRSPGASSVETIGWISMGPGPSIGYCFTPPTSSIALNYTFTSVSFSVDLKAKCSTGDNVSAAAAYNLTLEGNVYDLTTARFVWATNLARTVGAKSVACHALGHARYDHTFHLTKPVVVSESSQSMSNVSRYWFIVSEVLTTSSSATSGSASAEAKVTSVSADLSQIVCHRC